MQGRSGRTHRRSGGDDIVDDQHRARWPPHDIELDATDTFVQRLSGLRGTRAPSEEAPTRQAKPSGESPGQQFGLVVSAVSSASGRCRCPRDDIDIRSVDEPGQRAREQLDGFALIVKLESTDE